MHARQFTADQVFDKVVEVIVDCYGSTSGTVRLPGDSKWLKGKLVENGLAWVYRNSEITPILLLWQS